MPGADDRRNSRPRRQVRGAPTPAPTPEGLGPRRAAVASLAAALGAAGPAGDGLDEEGPDAGNLSPRDRGLAHLIVLTTLRRLPQIEAVLAAFLRTPIDARGGSVRHILSTGAAQILFLGIAPHAVVNIAAALAAADPRGQPLTGLVNAVLRRIAREGPAMVAEQDAGAMVLPGWIAERWAKAYGPAQTRAMAELILEEPPLDLSVRGDAAAWAERLGGSVPADGTVRLARAGRIVELAGYDEGAWWVQDAAAALPVRLLGDLGGLTAIDLCAAPGGKTAQLAAAGAQVTALDRDRGRMQRLGENLARLGLAAERVVADARTWRPAAPADVVVLDAPCSATGIMQRHPDIMRRRKPGEIADLAQLQGELLDAALAMTRPGGRLLYATCSLEPEEGEAQIARLLASGAPVEVNPARLAPGNPFAACVTPSGTLRILPTTLAGHGGNSGFFAAILNRLGTNHPAQS